jgi:hypothetical protein
MKGLLATGTAALVVGVGATVVLAQQPAQPPPPPRPYYVGNALGLPITPPAPTAENPNPGNPFNAMSSNVKVYGAIYSTESCSYDPGMDLIVAPARGVGQAIRANDAFVALINHDGSVHTARWIGVQNAGAQRDTQMTTPLILNEPFGTDIVNGILYLADRTGGTPDPANPGQNLPTTNAIAMFDMTTGEPTGRMELAIPAFNDIEVMEDGTIYGTISGNMGQVIKVNPDGTHSVFVETGFGGMNSPNGIAFDPDGNIVIVNIGDNNVITFAPDGTVVRTEQAVQGGNDGLVIMPDGTKFISSVTMGGVSMIRPGEAAVLIAENIPSAASMCYDAGANQLVIPMNANNALAFVPLDGVWAP